MSNIDNNVLRPWLERMKQGDFEAAQEIFARFNDQIYRTVYFLTRNKSEVKRVVRRRPILTIGIALIVLAVIAGFTSYTWIRFGDNRVQVEVRHTAGEALSSEQSARIHQRLVDVQSQLGNGESLSSICRKSSESFPK